MKQQILIIFFLTSIKLFCQTPLQLDSIKTTDPSDPGSCDGTFQIYLSGGCFPYFYNYGCPDMTSGTGACCGKCPVYLSDNCGNSITDTLRWCNNIATSIKDIDDKSIKYKIINNEITFSENIKSIILCDITGKVLYHNKNLNRDNYKLNYESKLIIIKATTYNEKTITIKVLNID